MDSNNESALLAKRMDLRRKRFREDLHKNTSLRALQTQYPLAVPLIHTLSVRFPSAKFPQYPKVSFQLKLYTTMSGHAYLARSDLEERLSGLEEQLHESKTTNNNLRTHIQYLERQRINGNDDDEYAILPAQDNVQGLQRQVENLQGMLAHSASERAKLLKKLNGSPSLQQYNAPGSNTTNNIFINHAKTSSRPAVVETDDDSDDTDDGTVIKKPTYSAQCKRPEGACRLHCCKFFHNYQLNAYGHIRTRLPRGPKTKMRRAIQG
jgi:hypothetical protein